MKVIVYTKDLMDRVKIEPVLKELQWNYSFHENLNSIDEKTDEIDLFIVDMSMSHAFELIKKNPKQCICYGPHMQTALFQEAKKLGCDHVFPRSAFFKDMKKMIEAVIEKFE